jgi:hypothetical protein
MAPPPQRRTSPTATDGVDEALVAEWARRFAALSPEERAAIDASAARELAAHGHAPPPKRARPRAAAAAARKRTT